MNTPRSLSPCLRRWRSGAQAQVRLLCFPWCGAGASTLRLLVEHLPGAIDPVVVQLPGREERAKTPALRDMDSVIEHVLQALELESDLPLVLFGHSMGAVVACELARALSTRLGKPPILLIVSGHGAPQPPKYPSPRWHVRSDAELVAHLRTLGGTPSLLLDEPIALNALLPVMRADYEILETHDWSQRQVLDCPIVACMATHDNTVDLDTIDQWRTLTHRTFALHWFEGDHFYLNKVPRALATRIALSIDRCMPHHHATRLTGALT